MNDKFEFFFGGANGDVVKLRPCDEVYRQSGKPLRGKIAELLKFGRILDPDPKMKGRDFTDSVAYHYSDAEFVIED